MGKNTPMIRVRPEDLEFLAEEQKRLEKIWGGKIPRTFVISDMIRERKQKRQTKKGKNGEDNYFGL